MQNKTLDAVGIDCFQTVSAAGHGSLADMKKVFVEQVKRDAAE